MFGFFFVQLNKDNQNMITQTKYQREVKAMNIREVFKQATLLTVLSIGIIYFLANYTVEKKVTREEIRIQILDCISANNCVVVKEVKKIKTSKLGELTTHKGVYVNSKILQSIDDKFTKSEAKILKDIMLAECAKDYHIDGKAMYECKSNTQNKNTNKTYDCGYLQINSDKPCTKSDFEVSYQIEKAYAKLHSKNNEYCGGLNCWSSYKFRNSDKIATAYNMWSNKK